MSDYDVYSRPATGATFKRYPQGILTKVASVSSVLAGNTVSISQVDMRQYESIVIVVIANRNAAATQYNAVDAYYWWTEDKPGTTFLETDVVSFFSQDNGASAYPTPGGRVSIYDVVRGPYFHMAMINRGADTLNATIRVYGSSRVIANRYVRETDSSTIAANTNSLHLIDTFSAVTLAAGATARYVAPLHIGSVYVRLSAGVTQHTFDFYDTFASRFESEVLAAGAILRRIATWSERATRLVVTNNGAVNGDHRVNIIGLKDVQ